MERDRERQTEKKKKWREIEGEMKGDEERLSERQTELNGIEGHTKVTNTEKKKTL